MNKDKNQIIENINDIFRRMGIAQKAGNPYVYIYLQKERASIVEGLETGCYKLVWDDEHEFVVDILKGSNEEEN